MFDFVSNRHYKDSNFWQYTGNVITVISSP